jgi:hypothetical protein
MRPRWLRGRTLICSNLAHTCRAERFRPLFQTEQHASRHEEPRRLDRIRGQPGPDASCIYAAARHELCSILVDRIKTKLPDPIKAARIPHVQHERAIGLDYCDRPAWASPEGNLVADGEVLKLRENASRLGKSR